MHINAQLSTGLGVTYQQPYPQMTLSCSAAITHQLTPRAQTYHLSSGLLSKTFILCEYSGEDKDVSPSRANLGSLSALEEHKEHL